MAKQIKVLKCPQCGNTKPEGVDKDHYRCEKCGTEFFLNNDDINVNVRHSYGDSAPASNSGNTKNTTVLIVVTVGLLFMVGVGFRMCSSFFRVRTNNISSITSAAVKKNGEFSNMQLFKGDKPTVFYIDKQNNVLGSDDSNGLYFVLYDVEAKAGIKKEQISDNPHSNIEHRYFESNDTHYFIVDNQTIFGIDTKTYSLKNMNADLAQAKPALNSGFSTLYFVPEKNGDGFRLTTNLGKEFYYFPRTEQLYTDRAFKHMIDGGMNTIDKDAPLRAYYLFQNKESTQSSNVAQLLKISYKYNNGGPENKLLQATTSGLKDLLRHRITSVEPIAGERICFSAEVLYFDDYHILTSFRPTLANDAAHNVQLLTITGDVLWTASFAQPFDCKGVTKTSSAFYILTGKNKVIEIKNDGQKGTEYNISKK